MKNGKPIFADRAFELLNQLKRITERNIPEYDKNLIDVIIDDSNYLFNENIKEVTVSSDLKDMKYFPGIQIRHSCLEQNKRSIIVYVYNRILKLQNLRWDLGNPALPFNIKHCFSQREIDFFKIYCENLDKYIKSVAIDVTRKTVPVSSLFVRVHCLKDAGKIVMEDGRTVNLIKNTEHLLPTWQCERLLRQGIVTYVDT